jgi:hypothetical protein
LSLKGTSKLLDFWKTDGAVPGFCVHIDNIQAQTVLVDDAVNPAITGSSDRATGILTRPWITADQIYIDIARGDPIRSGRWRGTPEFVVRDRIFATKINL